jgi:hypothetical protein
VRGLYGLQTASFRKSRDWRGLGRATARTKVHRRALGCATSRCLAMSAAMRSASSRVSRSVTNRDHLCRRSTGTRASFRSRLLGHTLFQFLLIMAAGKPGSSGIGCQCVFGCQRAALSYSIFSKVEIRSRCNIGSAGQQTGKRPPMPQPGVE